jgi:hypothetical protein
MSVPVQWLMTLFEAVTEWLRRLSVAQALVLILEDLHWADEMTLRLLTFVSHRLQGWPILIVATARDEELTDLPLLRRALAEVDRETHATRLALTPLGQAATVNLVRMLARTGSNEADLVRLGEEIWRTSEGNPFVVVETMRSRTGGAVARGDPLAAARPRPRGHHPAARRPQRAGPAPRRNRRSHRPRIEFALVQRAAEMDERGAAEAIEELVRRQLLQAGENRFDFTHDRIRQVAYNRLLPPRRRETVQLDAVPRRWRPVTHTDEMSPSSVPRSTDSERVSLPTAITRLLVLVARLMRCTPETSFWPFVSA